MTISKIYIGACSLIALPMGLPTDLMGGANRDIIAGNVKRSRKREKRARKR
jgi:hypothetical protein